MSGLPREARKLLWVSLFGIAFAVVEASVVVYLRSLYYPEGFTFPLKAITPSDLDVELSREAATILMLVVVGVLAGSRSWGKFAYFMVGFGVWDVFYYIWLRVMVNWPASLTEWDILFLIPVLWIGPVIAPVLISLGMVISGWVIVFRLERGKPFQPGLREWGLSALATAIILYSFTADTPATMRFQQPVPYRYGLLALGLVLYAVSFIASCRGSHSPSGDEKRGKTGRSGS